MHRSQLVARKSVPCRVPRSVSFADLLVEIPSSPGGIIWASPVAAAEKFTRGPHPGGLCGCCWAAHAAGTTPPPWGHPSTGVVRSTTPGTDAAGWGRWPLAGATPRPPDGGAPVVGLRIRPALSVLSGGKNFPEGGAPASPPAAPLLVLRPRNLKLLAGGPRVLSFAAVPLLGRRCQGWVPCAAVGPAAPATVGQGVARACPLPAPFALGSLACCGLLHGGLGWQKVMAVHVGSKAWRREARDGR